MNSKKLLLSLVFLHALLLGSAQSEVTINQDALLENLKILSADDMEGRLVGTKGSAKARQFIIEKFKALNVKTINGDYEQDFSFKHNSKDYKAKNVLGLVKGTKYPKSYIVVSAHYDHEGIKDGKIYNGADDDASGTSALFAFAEYLEENPPKHSVILAAFDAEEFGLLGAKHFVKSDLINMKKVIANVNMDMISRSDINTLWVVGPRYYKHLKAIIPNSSSASNFRVEIGHEGLDDKANWTNSSDHAPFHNKGIPFLFFTVDDHEDYHKPTDDFENIQPDFYIKSVKTIISVFEKIDDFSL